MKSDLRDRIVARWRTHTGKFLVVVLVCTFFAILLVIWLAWFKHYETLKAIGGSLVGLVGTALGAVFAFWFASSVAERQSQLNQKLASEASASEQKRSRQALTFDLHRDFSTRDMLMARTEADKLTEEHPATPYRMLYRGMPAEKTVCLFMVTDFYVRLSVSVEHNRVERELIPDLFGTIFLWWWEVSFKENVVDANPEWSISGQLSFLYKFLAENALESEWTEWNNRALSRKEARAKGIPQ